MVSASQTLKYAISKDQRLVAVAPPSTSNRVVVQIYQVLVSGSASCQLQLTLTHSPPKSSSSSDADADAGASPPLEELVFCGTSTVVARFGVSQVVLWDLDRGVVAQTLDAREEETFIGVATHDADLFYVLTREGQKLVVHEYAASTGKLLRKIKSGKWEGADHLDNNNNNNGDEDNRLAMFCVNSTNVIVQTSPGVLRVMDSKTGKKNGKIKAGKGSGSVFSNLALSSREGGTLATTLNTGATVLYRLSDCQETIRIPNESASSSHLQLENNMLLVHNTVIAIDGSSFDKLTTLKSKHPIAPLLTQGGTKALALIYQKRSGCHARSVDLESDDLAEIVNLDEDTPKKKDAIASADAGGDAKGIDASVAKRKAPAEPMILGPGQAGVETAPPVKKAKASDDDDDDENDDDDDDDDQDEPSSKDISIAERLQQLSSALDEGDDDDDDDVQGVPGGGPSTAFKAKLATTESLKELLTQALQSGEDSLVELALSVRDVKVISNTLKEIDPGLMATLMSKLTSRLAANPMRADQLALWLSQCLKQGPFQQQQLGPLRNLLHERTESFPDLLRLEGRLSLMCDVE